MPDLQRTHLAEVRAIVFDFDYTLVDSTPAFVDCHTLAATRLGLAPPAVGEVRRSVGLGLEGAVRFLYPTLSDKAIERYVDLYQSRADEVMVGQTVVLPGVRRALVTLNARGVRMAVVSQKLRRRVEGSLERARLLGLFDAVVGPEDVTRPKPDPEGVLAAMTTMDAGLSGTLYVGDTTIDARTAANAGLPFVAVLTGATTADELAPCSPALVLRSVADLPAALERP